MICFVNIEHEKALQDPDRRRWNLSNCSEIQLKLEEISAQACLVQRFSHVTRKRLAEWGIKALVISGNVTDWEEYSQGELDEMQEIIRAADLPILGFCGGHQLIALAHGAPLGPMRRLKDGEKDTFPEYQPGFYKERGFMPVRVLRSDPLFEGLGREPVFLESHYWEVKESPQGFNVLASTTECPVQAIKRIDKLVYGTQFHPELFDVEHTAGRRLIANFLTLAGVII